MVVDAVNTPCIPAWALPFEVIQGSLPTASPWKFMSKSFLYGWKYVRMCKRLKLWIIRILLGTTPTYDRWEFGVDTLQSRCFSCGITWRCMFYTGFQGPPMDLSSNFPQGLLTWCHLIFEFSSLLWLTYQIFYWHLMESPPKLLSLISLFQDLLVS